MAEPWAILFSTVLMSVGLAIIVFYIIPLQGRILWLSRIYRSKDGLNGLRLRLLLVSSFIAIAASPILTNRLLRHFGVESVYLSNISALSIGAAFLAFSIALVSVYHYKKKE
jgi:hypothetical protein